MKIHSLAIPLSRRSLFSFTPFRSNFAIVRVDTSTLVALVHSYGSATVWLAAQNRCDYPFCKEGSVYTRPPQLKAIALGADACMIGRAWAYALAADGERGVQHSLAIIKNELRVGMALTGLTKVEQINQDILATYPKR